MFGSAQMSIIPARGAGASAQEDRVPPGRALIEQRLMGFVARALHEHPVIDDEPIDPEAIAANAESHTGRVLEEVLGVLPVGVGATA